MSLSHAGPFLPNECAREYKAGDPEGATPMCTQPGLTSFELTCIEGTLMRSVDYTYGQNYPICVDPDTGRKSDPFNSVICSAPYKTCSRTTIRELIGTEYALKVCPNEGAAPYLYCTKDTNTPVCINADGTINATVPAIPYTLCTATPRDPVTNYELICATNQQLACAYVDPFVATPVVDNNSPVCLGPSNYQVDSPPPKPKYIACTPMGTYGSISMPLLCPTGEDLVCTNDGNATPTCIDPTTKDATASPPTPVPWVACDPSTLTITIDSATLTMRCPGDDLTTPTSTALCDISDPATQQAICVVDGDGDLIGNPYENPPGTYIYPQAPYGTCPSPLRHPTSNIELLCPAGETIACPYIDQYATPPTLNPDPLAADCILNDGTVSAKPVAKYRIENCNQTILRDAPFGTLTTGVAHVCPNGSGLLCDAAGTAFCVDNNDVDGGKGELYQDLPGVAILPKAPYAECTPGVDPATNLPLGCEASLTLACPVILETGEIDATQLQVCLNADGTLSNVAPEPAYVPCSKPLPAVTFCAVGKARECADPTDTILCNIGTQEPACIDSAGIVTELPTCTFKPYLPLPLPPEACP